MWIILSVIALVSLIAFFARGPNPIWGGATAGLIIGFIIALVRDGFDLFVIWKVIVVGVILGILAELLARLGQRLPD